MALRVSLLGEVEITTDAAHSRIVRPRQLAVAFAYLVLHRQRPITRDELVDALWDDRAPGSWETALRVVLSKLRAIFDSVGLDGAGVLRTFARSYRLALPTDAAVDVEEAAAAVTNAEAALDRDQYLEAATLAGRGGELASATLLAGEDAPWLVEQRAALADLVLRALEAQALAALGQQDGATAVAAAVKAVAAAPLRESAYQLLIRAHATSGNRADALRAYEAFRLLLADELGVDPSPQTQAVYIDLLRQDGPMADVTPRSHAALAASARPGLPAGTVTFLFTDIEGSTLLAARLGDDWSDTLDSHRQLIVTAAAQHSGVLVNTDGDGCFLVFTTATDAAAAAIAAQQALRAHPWPHGTRPQVRMGLHTATGVPANGDYSGIGVHTTARIMGAGHGGQILLSATTAQLVTAELPERTTLHDLGEHVLKDLASHHLWQLDHPDLALVFPPLRTLTPARHNLAPARTSFVGRQEDLAAIAQHLESTRLLTLVAPGGAGKTRLAYQAAADVVDSFPGGVWAVELSPLTNADLLPATVAAALDVHDQSGEPVIDAIATRLKHQPTMLILDNCEHLINACAQFCDDLLSRCAHLRILATSREPLLAAGETTWRVRSLSVPDSDAPVEILLAAEAVALFAERARGTDPLFTLGEADARVIADICRRLDGIPLAIELAAARTRVLTVDQIAARLDDRFRLLTAGDRTAVPRQRTLKALIDWSYELLDDDEATVFRRLSIFPSTFSIDAAEHVCAGQGIDAADSLDLLDQLAAKSLLTAESHSARRRLRMLETIRVYAQQELKPAETDRIAARHARYFVERAHSAAAGLAGPDRAPWLRQVSDDYDNFRAALSWARDHDPVLGLCLAGDLSWFWYHQGHFGEGRDWLARFLATNDTIAPPGPRARALTGAARLARYLGAPDEARAQAEEAVRLARLAGNTDDLGYALNVLGLAAQAQNDHAAIAAAQASVAAFRDSTNRWGLALALFYVGTFSVFLGEDQLVRPALEESRGIFEELDDGWGVAGCLYYTGMMEKRAGDLSHASSLIEQSVTLFRAAGDRWRLATALETLAELRVAQGEPATAQTEEAANLRRQLGAA